jgi:hypothetical protein
MTDGAPPVRRFEPGRSRRSLLVRAAIFHAVRARLGRLCELQQDSAVRAVMSGLDRAVQTCMTGDLDDRTLVTVVAGRWVAELAEIRLWRGIEPEVERLLVDLQELAGAARPGNPIAAIFDRIESLSRELYGGAWRPATLTVTPLTRHPFGLDPDRDPYALTAEISWPPEPPPAQVTLWIYDGFGPDAYAAIPILLIHECVCHVAAVQEKAKNDSQFAEGFLDWMGHHFLRLWAAKLDSLSASAAESHAARLSQLRANQVTVEARRARRLGSLAATDLAHWFHSECRMGLEESSHRVAMLAVELNLTRRSIATKDQFVSLLALPFPPAVEEKLHAWTEGLATSEELLDLLVPA